MSRYKSSNSTMITGSMCDRCQETTWVRYPSSCDGIEYICLNCGSIEHDVIEYSDIEEPRKHNLYTRAQNTAFKFFEFFDFFAVIIIVCVLGFSIIIIIAVNATVNDRKNAAKKKEEQMEALNESTVFLPLYKEKDAITITIPDMHINLPASTFTGFKSIDTIKIPKTQFVELITNKINNSTYTEEIKKQK